MRDGEGSALSRVVLRRVTVDALGAAALAVALGGCAFVERTSVGPPGSRRRVWEIGVAKCFLPGAEPLVADAVGARALPRAVGVEAERVALGQVVGGEGHVPGVGPAGRTRPPEQPATDPTLVRDEVDPEIGPEAAELVWRLDPPIGGDEEVALRRGRQVVGVMVDLDRRALLGGRRAHRAMLPPVPTPRELDRSRPRPRR